MAKGFSGRLRKKAIQHWISDTPSRKFEIWMRVKCEKSMQQLKCGLCPMKLKDISQGSLFFLFFNFRFPHSFSPAIRREHSRSKWRGWAGIAVFQARRAKFDFHFLSLEGSGNFFWFHSLLTNTLCEIILALQIRRNKIFVAAISCQSWFHWLGVYAYAGAAESWM